MLGRGNALLACAVLVLAGQLAMTAPAHARDGEACHTDSRAWRYVVLFDEGTPADQAERVIRSACGELAGYHPDIAVAVATSADPEFDATLGTDRAFSADRARHERAYGSTLSVPAPSTPAPSTPAPSGSALAGPSVTHPTEHADLGDGQWDMHLTGARLKPAEPDGLDEVTVGVLDSGIDAAHPDLAGAIDPAASAGCLTGVPDRVRPPGRRNRRTRTGRRNPSRHRTARTWPGSWPPPTTDRA
ncbi:hypothetical protein [Saccharomonospora sp. CUA-673]|uniref:hypothetical protein n=1 Tax=Saccharomonospora sp. CUA-673 TaxID=1904969 RepID=UPI002101C7AB|nr:hypothetical protein [Saccharomonospora sp. CUA-673]